MDNGRNVCIYTFVCVCVYERENRANRKSGNDTERRKRSGKNRIL